ncbi:hypothetical protein [Sedimentibacter sp.]|uniref:hypothetical protein n=1 Tax=Sedimentibacter sp. TaxID=1960295 RepID=UPI00289F878F|nr:hypothetical protein [Sedimentibacter sp.]
MKNNYTEQSNNLYPIDSVMKSVFIEEFVSIGMDIAEESIDSLLDADVLSDIPIVKTIRAIAKVSLAIREKYLLKKMLIFIETINHGKAKSEEIEKRKKAAESNEKWLRKEIELITIHIDRLDELEKARLTAAFYIEYINLKITWLQYREYLAIIERVFFQDFIQLLDIYDAILQDKKVKDLIKKGADGGVITKKISELNCDRLIAVGLVQAKRSPIYNGNMLTDYDLTRLGLKFAEVLNKLKK